MAQGIKTNMSKQKGVYPLAVSISMIVAAVLLSFVDLAFLNDVIGKLLDLGSAESMAIAFALGLVGISIMAHLGIKEAHGSERLSSALTHYLLWVGLGVLFVLIRLFSAALMQLDESLGDEALMNFFGFNIRQVDLVLGPVMMILYLATGILAKDGFKHLLVNDEFENWRDSWKQSRLAKKTKEDRLREQAEKRIALLRDDAERKQKEREEEIEQDRINKKRANEQSAIANALNGNYSNALAQYRAKEKEIKEKYQKIAANMDEIKNIDKQEKDFETKVKPGLITIVRGSITSVRNNTAWAIRKKTGEDINRLRETIASHIKN